LFLLLLVVFVCASLLLFLRAGYRYWKAFTTGKPASLGGIPHDTYGMTTRGVHRYVLSCLEKLGWKEEEVTKVQCCCCCCCCRRRRRRRRRYCCCCCFVFVFVFVFFFCFTLSSYSLYVLFLSLVG
jgi:hypothetical protein